jgi:cytochrome c6
MRTQSRKTIAALAALAMLVAVPVAASADDGTAELWKKKCASCHGADGKADTKMGKKLSVQDLTDPAVQAKFDRDRMIKATVEGVKDDKGKVVMKPFESKLTAEQIAALTDYILAMPAAGGE